MSRVIWKHGFNPTHPRDLHEVLMPQGSVIWHFAMQGNFPTMWYECNPELPKGIRKFKLLFTGEPTDEQFLYRGTIQNGAGGLVYHLVELLTEEKSDEPIKH